MHFQGRLVKFFLPLIRTVLQLCTRHNYALYFLRYADNLLQLDNGVKVPPRLVLAISAFFLKFNNGDAVA